jgi:hypothetical protein
MKKKLPWAVAFIIAATAIILGLSMRDKAEGAERPGLSLKKEFLDLRTDANLQATCIPDPLPEVLYTIGKVKCQRGELCLVPVYVDTGGLDTWGALLFIDYTPEILEAEVLPEILPGPMWDGFYSATAFSPEDGMINMLILGWHEGYDDYGNKFAYPIQAEELVDPLFFFMFTAETVGKADVRWRALPNPPPRFFRRFESLVDTECGTWDVVDYYEGQETGTADVKAGKVKVELGKSLATKQENPSESSLTWTQIKVLYR